MTARGALMLSGKDNVATLLEDVAPGTGVLVRFGSDSRTVNARENIIFGFKIAVSDIARGAAIIKYGEPIGIASSDIKQGDMVHVHNLEGGRGRGDLAKGEVR
ncbi:MAG: UxaA family hydrolase [Dehalococcoidia bacterium]|nr:UxaA family hydrolase [Dehalococcoidia bacterium]